MAKARASKVDGQGSKEVQKPFQMRSRHRLLASASTLHLAARLGPALWQYPLSEASPLPSQGLHAPDPSYHVNLLYHVLTCPHTG